MKRTITIKNTILAGTVILSAFCGGGSEAFATTLDTEGNTWYTYSEALELRKEVIAEQDEVCDRSDLECREDYMRIHGIEPRYNLASRVGEGIQNISYIDINSNKLGYFYYSGDQDLSPWGMWPMDAEIVMISFVQYDDEWAYYNSWDNCSYEDMLAGEDHDGINILYRWTKEENGPLVNGEEITIQLPRLLDLKKLLINDTPGLGVLVYADDGYAPYLQSSGIFDAKYYLAEPNCLESGKACETKVTDSQEIVGFKLWETDVRTYDENDAGDEEVEEGEDKGNNEEEVAGEETATTVDPTESISGITQEEGVQNVEEGTAYQEEGRLVAKKGTDILSDAEKNKGTVAKNAIVTASVTKQSPKEEEGDVLVAQVAGDKDGDDSNDNSGESVIPALGVATSDKGKEKEVNTLLINMALIIIPDIIIIGLLSFAIYRLYHLADK